MLTAAKLSEDEIKVELAVHLYVGRRLSIGKACELAGLSHWQFRRILASREIPADYDVADLEVDFETLKSLGRL